MGSSSLKADVNALERLQTVLGSNSGYCGEKYKSCTRRAGAKLAFDEGLVDDHLGRHRAELRLAPGLYLLSHRLEVPLLPVHTDRDGVYKRQAFRVFGQDRLKVTAERHIAANRDLVSTGQSEAHTLVVAVAQTDRETAPCISVSRSRTPNIFIPSGDTAYSSAVTWMCRKPSVSTNA
jgi:hypothetical protein